MGHLGGGSFQCFLCTAGLSSAVKGRLCRPALISQPPEVLAKTKGLRGPHKSSLTRLLMLVFEVFKLFTEICMQKSTHIISIQLDELSQREHASVTDAHVDKQ